MWQTQAKLLIQAHEGLRLSPYKDQLGILTVGYGYNLLRPSARADLAAVGAKLPIVRLSLAQAQLLFDPCFEEACNIAGELVPSFDTLTDNQKCALVDMAYNIGPNRMRGFTHMLAALASKDYTEAAAQMLSSKWAGQVGPRAIEDARLLQSVD